MINKLNTKNILKSLVICLLAMAWIFGVSQSAFASFHGKDDFFCDHLLDCGDKGEVTDFIDLEGGLDLPSGEGLPARLTEVKSATQFIVNVTNFVLSFLGLAAVLVIIYGGILYVTAHGNDEQTGKAKKSITYAIVGIFVVLISFALVNTILKFAPIGQPDTGEGGGRGTVALNTSDLGKDLVYHVAALEIQANMQNLITAYRIFSVTHEALQRMQDIPEPADREEAISYLEAQRTYLSSIVNQTPALSEIHTAARKIINEFIDPVSADLRRAPRRSSLFETAYAQFDGVGDALRDVGEAFDESIVIQLKSDFLAKIDEAGLRQKNDESFEKFLHDLAGRLEELKKALGPIAEARTTAESLPGAPEEIKRVLSGLPANFTVGQAFEDATASVRDLQALLTNPDEVTKVADGVKTLGVLRIMIRDIKFVFVRLNANVLEGNAPLAVQFDALGSLDPSGKTIASDKYSWDLDGDGNFNEPTDDCKEDTHGASATCVFKNVGTYRAALKISGSRPDIATGISYLTIKVNPPRSRISLTATSGENEEVLRGYDESGRLTVEKTSYRITKSEGKNGVSYDASLSTDGSGVESGLTYFEWSFGDGSDTVSGATAKIIDNPKKTYSREGTFPLALEVTDKGGIKDRKIANVVVANIAARIQAETFRGDLGKTFEFDGSSSKSDIGPIRNFEWVITDQDGQELELENNESDTLRHQFASPGKYSVNLKVIDGAGNEDTAEVSVIVESQAPKAIAKILGCFDPEDVCLDRADPGLTELDASKSFDPDPDDEIAYLWEIPGATEDVHFTVVENSGDSWETSSTATLRFLKKGEYRVKLTVSDQHTDEDLRKSNTVEQKINITSVLSLSFDPDMETAAQITPDEPGAVFEIKANLGNINDPNAVEAEIEYGDSKSESFPPFPSGVTFEYDDAEKTAILTVSHTYEEAGTYLVRLHVTAPEGETTIQKQLYVTSADSPFAIIQVEKNGVEIFPEDDGEIVEGNRNDLFTFDGSASLNTDGSHRNLKYSWDFGDGRKNDRAQTSHKYESVSPQNPGYFEVKLTVFDPKDVSKKNTAVFLIKVAGEKPTVQTLNVVRRGTGDITPLEVEVTAEGAADPDGQIREYTFWYFDPADEDHRLGVTHVTFNRATLRIDTFGLEGEEKKYLFCVSLKDNENNEASCEDLFEESSLPYVEVINGANQSPIADFTVSRTSLKVGESVIFVSSSRDPDGRVTKYIWDFDGDGFHNDTETDNPRPTHTYETPSGPGGFPAQLKVIDDKGGNGYSLPKYIYVDPLNAPPIADFTCISAGALIVRCQNTSHPAPGTNVSVRGYSWDFDTGREFCNGGSACPSNICQASPLLCDSQVDNDPDRGEQNPDYEYQSAGNYTVKLTIEDEEGQKSSLEKQVRVERSVAAPSGSIDAVIQTDPVIGPDQKLHLRGNGANINFQFNQSLGRISRYVLDKNIYFDTGVDRPDLFPCGDPNNLPPAGPSSIIGDGCLDNDADEISVNGIDCLDSRTGLPRTGCSTYYQLDWLCNNVSWAPRDSFRAKLTVFGTSDSGQSITDTKLLDITFDQAPTCSQNLASLSKATGSAYLFQQFGAQEAIILGILSGAIIAFLIYGISLFSRSGKPRNINI